jgi:hypothetical protein
MLVIYKIGKQREGLILLTLCMYAFIFLFTPRKDLKPPVKIYIFNTMKDKLCIIYIARRKK